MKRMQAIIAAVLITAVMAAGMLAVGVSAAVNTNSVPPSNSPNAAVATGTSNPNQAASVQTAQTQIDQLKSLIAQYQTREKQYQQQISTDNAQMQQLQSVLTQLQQAGIIRINADGSISVGRARGDDAARNTAPNGNTTTGGPVFR